MNISTFHDLLQAARLQPEPQRLLFVFAGAELPEDASAEQRASFESGEGGTLVPLMTVDKAPDELTGFQALADESRGFGPDWRIVFAAALFGQGGKPPTRVDAEATLLRMVDAIKLGAIGAWIPFDRQGLAVKLG